MSGLNEIFELIDRMRRAFSRPIPLYVKFSKNKIWFQRVDDPELKQVEETGAFSSERNLVGDFDLVEHLLLQRAREFSDTSVKRHSWQILLHPTELIEGGLSDVETRVFQEICLAVFGVSPVIWQGKHLSPEEVLEKLAGPGKP